MLDRTHNSKAGHGVVLGQNDHLDERIFGRRAQIVQRKQSFHEGESHSTSQVVVEVLRLIDAVTGLAAFVEHRVRLAEVEQSTGRDPDHEAVLELEWHVTPVDGCDCDRARGDLRQLRFGNSRWTVWRRPGTP